MGKIGEKKEKKNTIKREGIDRRVDDGDESHAISSYFQNGTTLSAATHLLVCSACLFLSGSQFEQALFLL